MRLTALLFLLAITASAQNTQPPEPQPSSYKAQCDLYGNAPGCASYNELVRSKDKDVLDFVSVGNSFVCFRESTDIFTLVSFAEPKDSEFVKDEKSGLSSAIGIIFLKRYSKGLHEDIRVFPGKWKKYQLNPDILFSSDDPSSGIKGDVGRSEINLSYTFQNLSNSTTNYSIQIRRSTGRFTEIWETVKDEKQKTQSQAESSGRCAAFH